eukprot:scaffold13.g414.t1
MSLNCDELGELDLPPLLDPDDFKVEPASWELGELEGASLMPLPPLPAQPQSAPAAASSGKAGPAGAVAVDPELEKRRAQNREAMQRYRQRQRQKRTELARLEKEANASTNRVLEVTLALREEWLKLLLQTAAAAAASGEDGASSCSAADVPGPPRGASSGAATGAGTAAMAPPPAREPPMLLPPGGGGVFGPPDLDFSHLARRPKLVTALAKAALATPGMLAAVRAMTPEQFFAQWDHAINRCAELLAVVDATSSKEAEAELLHLVMNACLVFDCMMLVNPVNIKRLFARTLPPPAEGQPPIHDHWRSVAASITLTDAQRHILRQEFRSFRRRHAQLAATCNGALLGVRAAAAAAAAGPGAAAAAAEAAAAPGSPSFAAARNGGTMAGMVDRYVQLVEQAGQLSAAADEAWVNLLAFSDAAFLSLSPLQAARLLATSRPHFPDSVQLVQAVLEAGGDASDGGLSMLEDDAEGSGGGEEVQQPAPSMAAGQLPPQG